MAKTERNPKRQPAYKTVQFWVAAAGLWLFVAGATGSTLLSETEPEPSSAAPSSSRLQVRPARQQPGSVINELQDAGGLQNQTGSNLQQPTTSDQLQPNAKTDSFTPTAN